MRGGRGLTQAHGRGRRGADRMLSARTDAPKKKGGEYPFLPGVAGPLGGGTPAACPTRTSPPPRGPAKRARTGETPRSPPQTGPMDAGGTRTPVLEGHMAGDARSKRGAEQPPPRATGGVPPPRSGGACPRLLIIHHRIHSSFPPTSHLFAHHSLSFYARGSVPSWPFVARGSFARSRSFLGACCVSAHCVFPFQRNARQSIL